MGNLSLQKIRDSSTKDLVSGLRLRKFSLLKSMGFRKLRAGMVLTGLLCRLFVALTGLRRAVKKAGVDGLKYSASERKRAIKVLQFFTPLDKAGNFPHSNDGIVFGFNHPSLGEILRFILICVTDYRFQRNLFPVNLPWYEALMPIVNELEALGIYITPIITPSTREKMTKSANDETMTLIGELANRFNVHYLDQCVSFIKANNNVWIAPSATRQKYLFKTANVLAGNEAIQPQTMSLIVIALERAKVNDCAFLPVSVVPPHNYRKGLNLFRKYRIGVGEIVTMTDARTNAHKRCDNNKGRAFEYLFMINLASALMDIGGSKLICPSEQS